MNKIIVIIITAISLSGCSLIADNVDKAAKGVGRGVTWYCDNADADLRDEFARLVNESAAPNSINVTCANGFKLNNE